MYRHSNTCDKRGLGYDGKSKRGNRQHGVSVGRTASGVSTGFVGNKYATGKQKKATFNQDAPNPKTYNRSEIVECKEDDDYISGSGLYKFSWEIFEEHSYIDEISADSCSSEIVEKPLKSVEESVYDIQRLLSNDQCHNGNSNPITDRVQQIVELIDTESTRSSHIFTSLHMTYDDLQKNLHNKCQEMKTLQRTTNLLESDEGMRQHKLFILALLSQDHQSTSIYKVAGWSSQSWMYKKIHLVGDSRIRNLCDQEIWSKVKNKSRPHLHCRDDLTLFGLSSFLPQTIPLVTVKGRMLVVCSLGIRDAVRHIDECGVLVTLEILLQEMKRIRKEFSETYGKEHDILFTDILPVDLNYLLKLHQDEFQSKLKRGEKTKEQLNETTLKLIKLSYLLAKNMMVEDLSRLRHLPTWEIFMNPNETIVDDSTVHLPFLKDGLNPSFDHFPMMGPRLSRINNAYDELKDPPTHDKTPRDVMFVCSEKYSMMEKFWPKNAMSEKPTFVFLDNVVSDTIVSDLEHYFPLSKGTALVIWFDVRELFVSAVMTDCKNHASLQLSYPSFRTPSQLFDNFTLLRKEIERKSKSANVVFTTLCPVDYKFLTEQLIATHRVYNHEVELPPSEDMNQINEYLLAVIDRLNHYIIQSNRVRGLPAWDLCINLYKRDRNGALMFNPPLSPDSGSVKPPTVAKLMMSISKYGEETSMALNWLQFIRKNPVPRKEVSKSMKDKLVRKTFARRSRSPMRSQMRSQFQPNQFQPNLSRSRSPLHSRDMQQRSLPGPRHYGNVQSNTQVKSPATFFRPECELPFLPRDNRLLTSTSWPPNDATTSQYNRDPVYYDQNGQQNRQAVTEASKLPHQGGGVEFNRELSYGMMSTVNMTKYSMESKRNDQHNVAQVPVVPRTPAPPLYLKMAEARKNQLAKQDSKVENAVSVPSTSSSSSTNGRGSKKAAVSVNNERHKISFGIKAKEEKPELQGDAAEEAEEDCDVDDDFTSKKNADLNKTELADVPNSATLEKIVASLRVAHEREVDQLRKNPANHSRYDSQHQEFLEQAVLNCQENGDTPNIDSIEMVWEVCWNMQLEKSFQKTWDKRVSQLLVLLGKEKQLPLETRATITRLTKLEPVPEPNQSKFSNSETNLYNKFNRRKRCSTNANRTGDLQKGAGVVLGERMLNQVEKGWRTIGYRKSRGMLDSALSKIDDYMSKPITNVADKINYINLGIKMKAFKDFLNSKKSNPFSLDYDSIAEITKTFSSFEIEDYVTNMMQNKGVETPVPEDVAMICEAIKKLQGKNEYASGFVKGDTLNLR